MGQNVIVMFSGYTFNLQAIKGGGNHPLKVFSISHFLHLGYNFGVLGSCLGPFAHI